MAQFKVIPPETGTERVSLRSWSNRPGARGLRQPAVSRTPPAKCIPCRTGGSAALGQMGDPSLLPSLSAFPPQTPPFHQHYLQTKLQKPGFYISFFFLLRRKKVDDSLRLKSCAIQQTNFLFRFFSLLVYGIQLNIIEAGSWFAVWAI